MTGTATVFVGQLSYKVKEKDIRQQFEQFGKILNLWLARHPPGFAFIEFAREHDAQNAVLVAGQTSLRVLDKVVRVELSNHARARKSVHHSSSAPVAKNHGVGGVGGNSSTRGRKRNRGRAGAGREVQMSASRGTSSRGITSSRDADNNAEPVSTTNQNILTTIIGRIVKKAVEKEFAKQKAAFVTMIKNSTIGAGNRRVIDSTGETGGGGNGGSGRGKTSGQWLGKREKMDDDVAKEEGDEDDDEREEDYDDEDDVLSDQQQLKRRRRHDTFTVTTSTAAAQQNSLEYALGLDNSTNSRNHGNSNRKVSSGPNRRRKNGRGSNSSNHDNGGSVTAIAYGSCSSSSGGTTATETAYITASASAAEATTQPLPDNAAEVLGLVGVRIGAGTSVQQDETTDRNRRRRSGGGFSEGGGDGDGDDDDHDGQPMGVSYTIDYSSGRGGAAAVALVESTVGDGASDVIVDTSLEAPQAKADQTVLW